MLYPKFNEQKATEAVSFLLQKHGGKMSRLKVLKLLYLADRKALERWERPITFDTYYSMKEGQVLSGVLNLIKNNIHYPEWEQHIEQADDNISIRLRGEPVKFRKLSKADVQLLDEIYKEFGHWYRFDLGDYTKRLPEYTPTTTRELTEVDRLLSYLYDADDVLRIERKLEERAYLNKAVGE